MANRQQTNKVQQAASDNRANDCCNGFWTLASSRVCRLLHIELPLWMMSHDFECAHLSVYNVCVCGMSKVVASNETEQYGKDVA